MTKSQKRIHSHPGTLRNHKNFQSIFVDSRRLDVWLPRGYSSHHAHRYPVVYAHDGQNLFSASTAFAGDWGLREHVQSLIDNNLIPPIIIVGIWNTFKRIPEYTPELAFDGIPQEIRTTFAEQFGEEPCSDYFLRFIFEEVKPFIDEKYLTDSRAEATFMLGSSMGGMISLYALCEKYLQLGGVACMSSAWQVAGPFFLDYLVQNIPSAEHHKKIYLDYGTHTIDSQFENFHLQIQNIITHLGYSESQFMAKAFPYEDHSEFFWGRRIGFPLRFLLKDL